MAVGVGSFSDPHDMQVLLIRTIMRLEACIYAALHLHLINAAECLHLDTHACTATQIFSVKVRRA